MNQAGSIQAFLRKCPAEMPRPISSNAERPGITRPLRHAVSSDRHPADQKPKWNDTPGPRS